MSIIYEVKPVNFQFNRMGGYNLPLVRTIVSAREALNGDWSRDAFAIVHYSSRGERTLLYSGYLNTKGNQISMSEVSFIRKRIKLLETILDNESSDAGFKYCCRPEDHYKVNVGGPAALFVKCKDGVIGVAWLDDEGNTKRAMRMCAFICYELGFINVESDRVLWEATTQNLPADAELIADAKQVEDSIVQAIREEAKLTGRLEVKKILEE